MNATQAAEHVGVAKRTMRRWIQNGQIPAEKISGQYVIDPIDLPLRPDGPFSEIDALRMIGRIMDSLDERERSRVLRWAADRWGVSFTDSEPSS